MSPASVIAATSRPPAEHFYFRVGHNDHMVLNRLIAAHALRADGFVVDARRHDRHAPLRDEAGRSHIATCLDTQAMELAMPGAVSRGHAELPWVGKRPHTPEDFTPRYVNQFIDAIVECVKEGSYSVVFAPTHYISDVGSAWIPVDSLLTAELRAKLDAADLRSVRIIYPLAVHYTAFYNRAPRRTLRSALATLPIDGITLRVHPFGAHSGPLVVRNFIEACWSFGRIERPLMIERAGLAGLAAFALGAVQHIQSGIVMGDSFDVGRMQRAPRNTDQRSYAPPQLLYIEALGRAVERNLAATLMSSSRGKQSFACKEETCCRHGSRDMLTDPDRHSALARQRQYADLARVPRTMRGEYFINNVIGPVCDKLSRAGDSHDTFRKEHRRMRSVKETLIDLRGQQKAAAERLPPAAEFPARPLAQVIPLTPRDSKRR